jgi:two-component system OmpR family response regulator
VIPEPFVNRGHHLCTFSPATDDPASLKTFIVEDNPLIRRNLVETMKELLDVKILGYAETEDDASCWLSDHRRDWQLLVIDLFLQQGSGLGVLKQCSNRSTQQRVVVLSNYATDEIRSRCMAWGADAVFDKSTELDQFLAFCAIKH